MYFIFTDHFKSAILTEFYRFGYSPSIACIDFIFFHKLSELFDYHQRIAIFIQKNNVAFWNHLINSNFPYLERRRDFSLWKFDCIYGKITFAEDVRPWIYFVYNAYQYHHCSNPEILRKTSGLATWPHLTYCLAITSLMMKTVTILLTQAACR